MSSSASGENAGVCPRAIRQPQHMRLAHWPNPLIFPETNYPGVRDLTHKFWTAGGFSDFNHTSMLVPQSNLYCLSPAPAFCQLRIDCYPASALYRDPSLSVSIRQPSPSLSLASWREKNSQRELRQQRTERKSDDFLIKLPLIL